jgi:hypothetical protein
MRRTKNGHTITDVTGRDRASGHRRPEDAIAHAWQLHDGPSSTTRAAQPTPITFDQALTVELAPGTTVVLSTTRPVTAQQLDEASAQWAARFPNNPLVILDGLALDSVIAAREQAL